MPQRDIGFLMIVVFFMLSGIDCGCERVAPYVHHKPDAYTRTTEPRRPTLYAYPLQCEVPTLYDA